MACSGVRVDSRFRREIALEISTQVSLEIRRMFWAAGFVMV